MIPMQRMKRKVALSKVRRKVAHKKRKGLIITAGDLERFFTYSWSNKRYVVYGVFKEIPKYRERALYLDEYITDAHIGTPVIPRDPNLDMEANALVSKWVRAVKKCMGSRRISLKDGDNIAIIVPFEGKKFIVWLRSIMGWWSAGIEKYEYKWQLDSAKMVIR